MRDMLAKKFERCCRGAGFAHIPVDGMYVSHDGLRVRPVLKGERYTGAESIDRRATLQLLLAARKQRVSPDGELSLDASNEHTGAPDAGAPPAMTRETLHPQAADPAPKSEATGARTPMASVTKTPRGD